MTTKQEHPGKRALEGLLEIQNFKKEGEKSSVVAALSYLHERVEALEKTMAERSRAFVPPTPDDVTAYARLIDFELDGQNFCDYYAARNWCVGKVKMKDWKACVRTWKSRRNQAPVKPQGRLPDNLGQRNEQY